jgi:hypothetical protein
MGLFTVRKIKGKNQIKTKLEDISFGGVSVLEFLNNLWGLGTEKE